MIIFFNSQPVTELVKIEKLFERARSLYGSDYYDLQTVNWFGDRLTVESLFPNWILQEYKNNPNNVLVIPIIKNYIRWLLSIEEGYGAQLDWENLRCPITTKSIFLEAYANFYFPGADFSSYPLKDVLPNIRKFLVKSDYNYFNIKGTSDSIKYIMCSLLGFDWDSVEIYTAESATIQINVTSEYADKLVLYKIFLEEYVVPAGTSLIYGTM